MSKMICMTRRGPVPGHPSGVSHSYLLAPGCQGRGWQQRQMAGAKLDWTQSSPFLALSRERSHFRDFLRIWKDILSISGGGKNPQSSIAKLFDCPRFVSQNCSKRPRESKQDNNSEAIQILKIAYFRLKFLTSKKLMEKVMAYSQSGTFKQWGPQ